MKKTAFTLIELVATIVILSIILAITVPTIVGIIDSSTKAAFESDAKMVLKAIDYKKLTNEGYDETTVTQNNIGDILGLSNENYRSLNIAKENDKDIISIIGTGKWDGLIACGTYENMMVVTSSVDCNIDVVPPFITILGDDPINMYVGELYMDAGAAAFDNLAGDITSKIVVTGMVNPNAPGTYIITYSVRDTLDNETVKTRTINVIDEAYPIINFNLNGYESYAKTRNTIITVTDLGVVDDDSLRYIWTSSTVKPSSDELLLSFTNGEVINTPINVSGTYYLWARAVDTAGNETISMSNAFNLDNIKPVITMYGDKNLTINKGNNYSDVGASGIDNIDAIITVTSSGTVNPNVVGSYSITYNAIDSSGNQADPVIRTINVIDALAPLITILGDNPVTLNVDSIYSDTGATATDDVDGDLTNKIITTGMVNPSVIGSYTITYTVNDTALNKATATRAINVIDNVKPLVSFGTNGNATYAKGRSTTVTVSDAHSGLNVSSLKYQWTTSTTTPTEASFTTSFTNGSALSTPVGVTGSYYLWILGKDNSGNTSIVRTNVFNLDNTKPIITLTGSSNITVNAGTSYSELGAAATDNIDPSVTVIISGSVNINVVGVYTITYNATDTSSNIATSVTRTISVIDTTLPSVIINPNGNATYAKGRSTIVTVSDVHTGVNASSLKYQWTTSTTTPTEASFTTTFTNGGTINTPADVTGLYYLWILGKDNTGNMTIIGSNVFNLDNTKPIITILGSNPISVNKGSVYSDAGASATDNINGSISVTATGFVSANVVGSYTITYNVSDLAGNAATPVTRTVNVIDVLAPTITITGSNPSIVSGGGSYSDAGASATDDVDGNVTSRIITTGTVNPNVLGTYYVTYNVTDTAGNNATATRTINVIDNIAPTVLLATVPTTWTNTNKTISVTSSDTGLSGISGYYISTSTTKPTLGSSWTANASTSWTVIKPSGTYYIWVKDNAGNISATYKSITVTNIDASSPIVTANSASYTITQGASNTIPGVYFTINQNGSAPISSTVCVDTSNGNATVSNTSALAVGTHIIRCTTTKTTGLSAYATTSIVVNPAYTCAAGTLTYSPTYGYVCVIGPSSGSSCNSCTYNVSTTGANCSECGSSCKSCSYPITIYGRNCDYCGTTCRKGDCEVYGEECLSCDYPWTEWGANCSYCGETCNTCTYTTSTYGSSCYDCGSYTYYYCQSGYSTYSGSGSSLTCYKAATQ